MNTAAFPPQGLVQQQAQQVQQVQGYPMQQAQQQQPQGFPMQQQVQMQNESLAFPPQGPPMQQMPQMQQAQQYQQVQGFPMQQMQQNMNTNAYMQQMPQMQQMQQMQIGGSTSAGFRLLQFAKTVDKDKDADKTTDKDEKLKLAAVIITICDGSTYDNLFSSVKQEAGEGSRVAVYSAQKTAIKALIDQLMEPDADALKERSDDLKQLLSDLAEIEDASCVAINYECCSECTDAGFARMPAERIISELEFFLSRGYLAMYSDFSLKALIQAWNEVGDGTAIGANPFVRTGGHNGSVTLNFNPFTLKTCISSQLQSVGELCPDQDFCTVHCMSGTVKYSLKPGVRERKEQETRPYDVEVLTVAKVRKHENSVSIEVPDFSKMPKGKRKGKDSKEKEQGNNSGKEKESTKMDVDGDDEEGDIDADVAAIKLPMKTLWGDAGHVVLDYSRAGQVTVEGGDDEEKHGGSLSGSILVSMTHWCELVKLGSSVRDDVLFKVAAKNLGTSSAAYQTMQAQYESLGSNVQMQQQWVMQQANQMVQQQAPCNNMMNSNVYMSKGKGMSKSKKGGY